MPQTFSPRLRPLSGPHLHQTQLLASLNRHLDACEKERIIDAWITEKLHRVSALLAKVDMAPEASPLFQNLANTLQDLKPFLVEHLQVQDLHIHDEIIHANLEFPHHHVIAPKNHTALHIPSLMNIFSILDTLAQTLESEKQSVARLEDKRRNASDLITSLRAILHQENLDSSNIERVERDISGENEAHNAALDELVSTQDRYNILVNIIRTVFQMSEKMPEISNMKSLRDAMMALISHSSPGHDSPIKQLPRTPLSIPVCVPSYELEHYVPAVLSQSEPAVFEIGRGRAGIRHEIFLTCSLLFLAAGVGVSAFYLGRHAAPETFDALDEKTTQPIPSSFFPTDNFSQNRSRYFAVYERKKGVPPPSDLEFNFTKMGSVSIVILGKEIVDVRVDGRDLISEDEFQNYKYLVRDLLD